jgi:hypothetical protein
MKLIGKASLSRTWPKTAGAITGTHSSSTGSARSIWAEYVYAVEGVEYHGAFFRELGRRDSDGPFKAQYPVGSQIEVWYDPAKPGEAEVEEDRKGNWFAVIFGVVVFGAGLFFTIADLVGGPR